MKFCPPYIVRNDIFLKNEYNQERGQDYETAIQITGKLRKFKFYSILVLYVFFHAMLLKIQEKLNGRVNT